MRLVVAVLAATLVIRFVDWPVSADINQWSTRGPDLAYVSSITVHPSDSEKALAASGRLYRTSDGGLTWVPSDSGLPLTAAGQLQAVLYEVAFAPSSTTRAYAGLSSGVARSDDAGVTWTLAAGSPAASQIAVHPSDAETVFGASGDKVSRSVDGGMTWTTVTVASQSVVFGLAVAPSAPEVLYAGTSHGVFRSADAGLTWAPANAGLPLSFGGPYPVIYGVAVHPSNPDSVHAATAGSGVYRSSDGGGTWTLLTNSSFSQTLAISPHDPLLLLSGSGYAGPYRTANGGLSWQSATSGMAPHLPTDFAFSQSSQSVVYAASYGAGVYRSDDGGMTWAHRSAGMRSASVFSLLPVGANGERLYAGGTGGLVTSTAADTAWQFTGPLLYMGGGGNVRGLAFDQAAGALYAAVYGHTMIKSVDDGATWVTKHNGLGASNGLLDVVADPFSSGTLFALGQAGLFKTTNGGDLWATMPGLPGSGFRNLALDPASTSIVYVGTSAGLYRSGDGGATWTAPSGVVAVDIQALATAPGRAYVSTGARVYSTTDAGASWQQVGPALSGVTALAADPAAPGTVWAANSSGVWQWDAGGSSWQSLGVAGPFIRRLLWVPGRATLYAAGTGVHELTPAYQVSVSTTSGGHVDASVSELACPGTCVAQLLRGTVVHLTAVPDPGWRLDRWSGACTGTGGCSFVVNGASSVDAVFVNTPPTASNGTLTTDEDVPASGVLAGSDAEGSALTFTVVTPPARGALTSFDSATGAFTYAPSLNANGTDTFTFHVSDGSFTSGLATMTIEVGAVDDAPVAWDVAVATSEGVTVAGQLVATDPDAGPRTFSVASQPVGGTVTLTDAATGAFTYTPGAATAGYDPFVFSVTNDVATTTATGMMFVAAVRPQWPGQTVRVSRSTGGAQGDGFSSNVAVSADGRVIAFDSTSSTFVAADTNGDADVFVHDRLNGTTTRVSVGPGGVEADDSSNGSVGISGNGRVIAFSSLASNLVLNDTNDRRDMFVRDLATGQTTRVSVASDGTQADGTSEDIPSVSADGRFVMFVSFASNLVPSDANGTYDVFVHDRATSTTERVSVGTGRTEANAQSTRGAMSADGRYVAFMSLAGNLVTGDTNGTWDAFVHDRLTGETRRVSVSSSGQQGNNQVGFVTISADGRVVAFTSQATNMVTGDTNGMTDAFVHDRSSGTTTRVSVSSGGAQANGQSQAPSLSADGRYVAFNSAASNLSPIIINTSNMFVHDRQTGVTRNVSVASDGTNALASSSGRISPDGRFVVFSSSASNLVAGDTNGTSDIFAVGGVSVTPTSANVGEDGGAGTVLVDFVYPGTSWTATSSQPWLAIGGQSSTTGDGVVNYSVPPNTGPARTASITAALQPVTIAQAASTAPVASNLTVTTSEDVPASGTLPAADPNGDPLTYSIVTGPARGLVGVTAATGAFTYLPPVNGSGIDTFTFRVSDGTRTSNTATVTVNIASVNDQPVAYGQSIVVLEDTSQPLSLAAADGDGDALAFTILVPPAHGVLSGAPPSVTYTPAPDYNGPDSFTFAASDGVLPSAPATVTLTVVAERWRASGPASGFTSSVYAHPSLPNVVFGTSSGLWRSNDGGMSFAASGTGLPLASVQAMAFDPIAPERMYVAVSGEGIYKSEDGGASFTAINTGLGAATNVNGGIFALAVDPRTPTTLYAGSNFGQAFKSTDGGANWIRSDTGLSPQSARAILVDPLVSSTIYASTTNGVFKSVDAGATWSPANAGLPGLFVQALGMAPYEPSTLYVALLGQGVFKTIDGGGTWTPTGPGLTQTNFRGMQISGQIPGTVYVGTTGGVFKTANGGATWSAASSGLTVVSISGLALDPAAADDRIYAATGGGLFRSAGATTWEPVGANLPAASILTLAIDPASSGTLYAGRSGVYKSTDAASTWATVNNGLQGRFITALGIDPLLPSTLYAATEAGVYKTVNAGGQWTASNTGLTSLGVQSVAVDPHAAGTVWVGTNTGGVFKTVNGGATWATANTGLTNLNIQSVVVDATTAGRLYAASNSAGVFRSVDGGVSWTAATTGLGSLSVRTLAVDPLNAGVLYAGTFNQGVYKSVNGGGNWTAHSTGLTPPGQSISALAIHPATPGVLYAATFDGVFRSTDAGATWAAVMTGLTTTGTMAVAVEPVSPFRVYVGTGGGVFVLEVSDNDSPVAQPASAVTLEDQSVTIPLAAADADGDVVTFQLVSQPSHGTIAQAGAAVVYTPATNFNGPDQFEFAAVDASGGSTTAAVTVTVTPVNDAPTVSIASPVDGASFALHESVTASYSCQDVDSALTACSGPVASGSPVDTATAGGKTFTVTATDSAGASAGASASYTVRRGVPIVTWPSPAAIVYGTPLGAAQLAASADVAGTFTYAPVAGTVLPAGTHALTASFTPANTADYENGSSATSLQVVPATPAISITGGVVVYDGLPHVAGVTAIGGTGGSLTPLWVTYNGVAQAPVDADTYTVIATYAGDANHTAGLATGSLTIRKATTTTSLSSTVAGPVFGQSVTLVAAVDLESGAGGQPEGTVEFFADGISLGSTELSGFSASLAVSSLDTGAHQLTASFSGDGNFGSSASGALTLIVSPAATTVALASDPNPSGFGSSTALTAVVTPVAPGAGAPSGQVSFHDGTTLLGTTTLTPQAGRSAATISTSFNVSGSHLLTASYDGEARFNASTSVVATHTVNAATATTTTTLVASVSASLLGTAVSFQAEVDVAQGSATPTGQVEFVEGGLSLGFAPLVASGNRFIATLTTSALATGGHTLLARYPGNGTLSASSSAPLLHTVYEGTAPRTTDTILTSSPNPSVLSQIVTLRAEVKSQGSEDASGVVDFYANGTSIGSASLSAVHNDMVATKDISTLPLGQHVLTAVYRGNGSLAGSASAELQQCVGCPPKGKPK